MTYEITKADGSTVSVEASGYSWDKSKGDVAFYDGQGKPVISYRSGEWISLHMRSALLKADALPMTRDEYERFYGL